MLRRVRASIEPQPVYPRLGLILRTLYLASRAIWHFRRMDFSIFPGWTGYAFWRVGMVGRYQRRYAKRIAQPQ
jgi:anaerobic magnesium-protoporphyrin IX monomethyl ester cyclase